MVMATPTTIPPIFSTRTRRRRRRLPAPLRISRLAGASAIVIALSLLFARHDHVTVDASSAAGQETLIGIVGKDFVLLGADSSVSQSIAVTASNLDKIAVISDPFPHYNHSTTSYSPPPPTTSTTTDDTTNAAAQGSAIISSRQQQHPSQQQRQSLFRQHAILAAAAGNAAEADRLLGLMTALASIQEYENGFGCDVDVIYCSSRSSSTSNNNNQQADHQDEMTNDGGDKNSKKNADNSHPLHPSRFFKMWTKSSTTASTATSDGSNGNIENSDNDAVTTSCDATTVTSASLQQQQQQQQQSSPLPPSLAGLTVEGVAQMARGQIANALRSRTPFRVCLLVAGLQPVVGAKNNRSPTTQRRFGQENQDQAQEQYMSLDVQRQVQSSWLVVQPPQPQPLPGALMSSPEPNDEPSTEATAKTDDIEIESLSSSSALSAEAEALMRTDPEQQPLLPQTEHQQQPAPTTSQHHHPAASHCIEPRLYWLDEYGSIQQLPYGAHGLGSHFIWSILDDGYRPDMERDEAIALIKSCFEQLRQRYVINAQAQTPPCIKCLDVNGWQLIR